MGGTASGSCIREGFLHPSPQENNRGFLTVLVHVNMAEQHRQEQPVEDEAAVATAGCPRPHR